jgi:hypothetical protein
MRNETRATKIQMSLWMKTIVVVVVVVVVVVAIETLSIFPEMILPSSNHDLRNTLEVLNK